MEPFWIPKKRQHFDNISYYKFTTFFFECEMSWKWDTKMTTFWQRFDNIFRTFWKWQRFDNILTTFWQHFLKKYLRENELILSCKWAVNYPIGLWSKCIRIFNERIHDFENDMPDEFDFRSFWSSSLWYFICQLSG